MRRRREAALSELVADHASAAPPRLQSPYLGDADRAFAWLERADREKLRLIEIDAEILLRNLHGDARWQALLQKMGLADGLPRPVSRSVVLTKSVPRRAGMKKWNAKVRANHKVHTPTIACINHASADLGVDFDDLIAALQVFVNEHVAPVWGTPAKLIKAKNYRDGCWAMVFLDHATHAKARLSHAHPDGYPQSKVFVKRRGPTARRSAWRHRTSSWKCWWTPA
jgi:hypothetical protein